MRLYFLLVWWAFLSGVFDRRIADKVSCENFIMLIGRFDKIQRGKFISTQQMVSAENKGRAYMKLCSVPTKNMSWLGRSSPSWSIDFLTPSQSVLSSVRSSFTSGFNCPEVKYGSPVVHKVGLSSSKIVAVVGSRSTITVEQLPGKRASITYFC